MFQRLPNPLIVNGLFDSYRTIRHDQLSKSDPLKNCMRNIDTARTLENWREILPELFDLLIVEVKNSGRDLPTALWETIKTRVYAEHQRDLFLKTIAAAFSDCRLCLYPSGEAKSESPSEEFSAFNAERKSDLRSIEELEKQIRTLKTDLDSLRGRASPEAIASKWKKVTAKINERQELILKWVRLGDPSAVTLASEINLLPAYRSLLDGPELDSPSCPNYLALNFRDYFFIKIIKPLDERTRKLNEEYFSDFEADLISGRRGKPLIPGTEIIADSPGGGSKSLSSSASSSSATSPASGSSSSSSSATSPASGSAPVINPAPPTPLTPSSNPNRLNIETGGSPNVGRNTGNVLNTLGAHKPKEDKEEKARPITPPPGEAVATVSTGQQRSLSQLKRDKVKAQLQELKQLKQLQAQQDIAHSTSSARPIP